MRFAPLERPIPGIEIPVTLPQTQKKGFISPIGEQAQGEKE